MWCMAFSERHGSFSREVDAVDSCCRFVVVSFGREGDLEKGWGTRSMMFMSVSVKLAFVSPGSSGVEDIVAVLVACS